MTPTADPTSAGARPFAVPVAVPARLLQEGEQIVLAIKPSPLYILIVSGPVLLAAAAVVLASYLLQRHLPGIPVRQVFWLALLAWSVRLVVAAMEWLARLYVLTNLRVLRVQGVLRVDVFECSLVRIQNTVLSFSLIERFTGLGTIFFATAGTGAFEAAWLLVARPSQVHEIVVQWIQKAHHNHRPPEPH